MDFVLVLATPGFAPKWSQLLSDFKLIEKPEDWDMLYKDIKKLPPAHYRMLRNGVRFTVREDPHELVYSDNRHEFVTKIDFAEDLQPIKILPKHASMWAGEIDTGNVSFIIRVVNGIDLGIRVLIEWWNELKESCQGRLPVIPGEQIT